jgi:hypothetical protein
MPAIKPDNEEAINFPSDHLKFAFSLEINSATNSRLIFFIDLCYYLYYKFFNDFFTGCHILNLILPLFFFRLSKNNYHIYIFLISKI